MVDCFQALGNGTTNVPTHVLSRSFEEQDEGDVAEENRHRAEVPEVVVVEKVGFLGLEPQKLHQTTSLSPLSHFQ